MGDGLKPSSASAIRRLGACLFLSASLAPAAFARQSGPGAAPPPGLANPRREAIERQEREAMLRGTELVTRRIEDPRGVQAAADQVKQDFRQIQVLRNSLVRRLTSDGPLDYKLIAEEAGEVNKRASRLKTLIVQQTPDAQDEKQKNQIELEGELLRSALVTLCRRIDSFTGNPVFKITGVIDVEQSTKAGGDLQGIIRLSARIKDGAERMSKNPNR